MNVAVSLLLLHALRAWKGTSWLRLLMIL